MLRLLFLNQFWIAEICHMSQTPSHRRRDAWPTNFTPKDAHASVFFYTFNTPYARHIRARFKLCGRPFHLSLLASFFWCCYERNSIHTASLSHFLSLVHLAHHLFFLSRQGQLLYSRKCQLFRLHIQHVTRLFEQWTPVGSSEAAVCEFCLSISLQTCWL